MAFCFLVDYFASASPSLWTAYEYDDYGRNVKITQPTGKIITTVYNGLTVSVNDEIMTKSKTMNANGHVVSATDTPGGTINFKYNASGQLLESEYDNVKTTTVYDAWGRRISLIDSSAGTYTSEYNAFGETLKETTPKGSTTYTLNAVGKPITKKVEGITAAEKTNITNTYTYDPTYKWLTKIDVTNPNDGNGSYEYTYDTTTKQLKQTVETLPYATFTKTLVFDSFGRVDTETTSGAAHGKQSSKTIKHTYKNGAKWQMLDGTTVIWQTNTVNAKGQITGAALGNGIAVVNTFDQYGFPTQFKHDLGSTNPTNVMTLGNSYDVKTGNLLSRTSSLFGSTENFNYDSNDRLIDWTGLPEEFASLYFASTTEGFTSFNAATVTNFVGQLKVSTTQNLSGTEKVILNDAVVGQILNIKGKFTRINGTTPIVAEVIETNTSNGATNKTVLAVMPAGNFSINHTVKQYAKLTLRFYTDESMTDTQRIANPEKEESKNLGTAQRAITSNAFYLDNIVLYKTTNNNLETQTYDNKGRIASNKIGAYQYANAQKPYQHTAVLPVDAKEAAYYQSRGNLNITYNAFKAPVQIEELGKDKISFAYNGMLERSAMYYGSTADDRLTRPNRRYYSADGSMEINYNVTTGAVGLITFIGGDAYSAPAAG